jgi:hypothetical protein
MTIPAPTHNHGQEPCDRQAPADDDVDHEGDARERAEDGEPQEQQLPSRKRSNELAERRAILKAGSERRHGGYSRRDGGSIHRNA